jgi:uncharacterized membrane protein
MYDWLKVIHVIGAITWVGGDIAIQFLGVRAVATKDAARPSEFAGDIEWLGIRLFTPASLVVLLAGIGMVLDEGIGFTPTWILAGLVGFGFSLVLGAGFLGPESGRIKTLIAKRGDTPIQRSSGGERGSFSSPASSLLCSSSWSR